MKPRRIAFLIGLALFFSCGRVYADDTLKPLPSPHVRLTTGTGELVGPDGQRYFLPLGSHILDGTSFDNLETEHKRLQDQETRLAAENKSLRESLGGWRPGWITVVAVLVAGAAAGAGGYYLYEHR